MTASIAGRAACGLAALALLFPLPGWAQTYTDRDGTHIPGEMPLPYPYLPVAPAQYGVAPTSSTALTVPATARYAVVCAEGSTVRYTTSGTTPTASVGMPLTAGTCVALSGPTILSSFLAYSSSGTMDVEYYR